MIPMEENVNAEKANDSIQPILAKSRMISLSYSQVEVDEVNSILTELQVNRGYGSETMKGLFLQILRNSVKEIQIPTENLKENSSELNDELIFKDAEISRLTGKISELEATKQELVESLEAIGNIEIETVETKTEPKPTDVYIELHPNETFILQTIADNRFVKRYDAEKASISEVAKMLIFNKATLYNWGGELFTGL